MSRQVVVIAVICFFAVPAGARQGPNEWFFPPVVIFKEHHPLSNYLSVCRRCGVRPEKGFDPGHQYRLEEESFGLYVPDDNDSNTPYGLLVWVQAGGRVKMPGNYQEVFAGHKLIYVAVNETEDERKSTYGRRLPLALDAAYNVMKMYKVDPNRVYVGGGSVSGRVASITAFHYPDVFKGGIFVIGANCWKRMGVPGKKGKFWRKGMNKPKPVYLSMARKDGRYVMLAGEKDFNRLQMHTYYTKVYKRVFKDFLYLEVPGMAHDIPPPKWFGRAVEFLDRPLKEK